MDAMDPRGDEAAGAGPQGSPHLDERETRLDRVVRLAARSLDVPFAAVTVFDSTGVRLRAQYGSNATAPEPACRPCRAALAGPDAVIIADTLAVPGFAVCLQAGQDAVLRFYAGIPLVVSQITVGLLCVGDVRPRELTQADRALLDDLAGLAVEALQSGRGRRRSTKLPLPAAGEGVLQFLDASSDLVFVHDLEGTILAVNKSVEQAIGYSRQEIEGANIDRFLVPECRAAARLMALESLGGAGPAMGRLTVLTRDGRRLNLEVSSRPLFGDGRPVGVRTSAKDVTARLEAEAQLSEKRSKLEAFASHLRQLHRLSTSNYDSIESLVNDHLAAGCEIFRLPAGSVVRSGGLPPIVHYACADAAKAAPQGASIEAPLLVDGDVAGVLSFRAHEADRTFTTHEIEIAELLAKSIGRALLEARMRDQLAHEARHDRLTGLANRSYQQDWLEEALSRARRDGTLVAVIFLDLDRFKQINDTLGHSAGDLLLRKVGERLRGLLDSSGQLARVGGDEFTAVLAGLERPEDAVRTGTKLLEALRQPFDIDGNELFITASLGISVFPLDATDASMLLRNSDAAMYRVKNSGRNDLRMFAPEPGAPAMENLALENQLRRAVENGELHLWFQPQMRLDGSLDGLEVLLVWENPKLGRIDPGRFIPVAEENGLIVPIGTWVLAEACRQAARWQRYGPVKVAVNVSALQFARPGFVSTVAEALRGSGLDPRLLELELTESLVMRDVEASVRRMSQLRGLGVRIAIDDFGTGYSSLSYLHSLPVNTLKIDRSFLDDVDGATETLPLIQTIIALAHNMGLCVVAEGVETTGQLDLLRKVSCDLVQGHFFGEPVSLTGVDRLLSAKKCV